MRWFACRLCAGDKGSKKILICTFEVILFCNDNLQAPTN